MTEMSPAEAIYFAALAKGTSQERTAYLDEACSADHALRRRVGRMLAAHQHVGHFMDQPAMVVLAIDPHPNDADATPLPAGLVNVGAAELPPRYQLRDEIGRGGMGLVLRGRDVDLDREVAIKVLLESHQGCAELRQRFVEEARISGRLQHPGVVPVYEVGRFADQRPYFTMKLVQGRTLAELLAGRRDPAEERARFVGVFLQVCQTVAYAHSRGIIHRDLKPSNVMVGEFGEVQVMDWGIAKALADRPAPGEAPGAGEGEPQSEQGAAERAEEATTRPGSVLGTPAYASPEQARGVNSRVDRRADVFGLGAMLCEILTGKPPYVSPSIEEVLRLAARGDLADANARLDACGADRELIVLTKACLSPSASDRPRDARAVTDALTAYLDGVRERLRQAELAQAEAKARAVEEVKRRRLALALAATVLLAFSLGGGRWLWVKGERDARVARTTSEINDALDKAAAFREQAKTATTGRAALFAQAREQAQRASALFEDVPVDDSLKERVRSLRADLDEEEKDRALVAALDEARLAQAEAVTGAREWSPERTVPKFREAFSAYGLPAGQGDPAAAARRIRQRPAAVREAIVAALDEWVELAASPRFGIVEPHQPWLRAVLEAAEPDDGWSRKVRAARAESSPKKRLAALEELARSAEVRDVPAPSLLRLTTCLSPPLAVELLRRARTQYPADFWINTTLGIALLAATPPQRGEAVRFLTAAAALRPESAGATSNLGIALSEAGQADEALDCFRKARDLDPKDAIHHNNLGNALQARGRVDDAIDCYKRAIEIDPELPHAHANLGAAWCNEKKDYDAAIDCFRKAIALAPKEARVRGDRGILDAGKEARVRGDRSFQARLYFNLGQAQRGKGQLDEAIASYQKAVDLDPKHAGAHHNLGVALSKKGRQDEAIASLREAIALDPNDATSRVSLGIALAQKGRHDEAIAAFRKAVALDPKHAPAHTNLGIALFAKGRVDEALASLRGAVELEPENAIFRRNLGNALYSSGKADEAIASFRKAIDLDPKYATAHFELGIALMGKGQVDGAIACYEKAIALDPKHAGAHHNLGVALYGKGQVDDAIACYEKAIARDPNLVQGHFNLGVARLGKGELKEAQGSLTRASRLLPDDHQYKAVIARLLRDCERFLKLEERLPRLLRGEDEPSSARESLDLATLCRQKRTYAAAARFFDSAFAADADLADDLKAGNRYLAATAAALAAAGKGRDADKLDDGQKAGLRKQALSWLKADLAARAKQPAGERTAALRYWLADEALAGVRGEQALRALPQAERASWGDFWSEVQKHLSDEGDR